VKKLINTRFGQISATWSRIQEPQCSQVSVAILGLEHAEVRGLSILKWFDPGLTLPSPVLPCFRSAACGGVHICFVRYTEQALSGRPIAQHCFPLDTKELIKTMSSGSPKHNQT